MGNESEFDHDDANIVSYSVWSSDELPPTYFRK